MIHFAFYYGSQDEDDPRKGMEVAQELQPIICQLVEIFNLYSR